MTKPARQPEEIEKIRNLILDKALDIIIEQGLSSLTMRKIASRTDMSATNLYNYFTNKEEIYLSILVRGYTLLHRQLKEVQVIGGDPIDRSRNLIASYLEFGLANPHYYDIMFSRPAPRFEDYASTPLEALASRERELTRSIIDIAVDSIESIISGKSGAANISGDARNRMVHVWCMLHGMVSLFNNGMTEYITPNPRGVYDQLIDEFFELIGNR